MDADYDCNAEHEHCARNQKPCLAPLGLTHAPFLCSLLQFFLPWGRLERITYSNINACDDEGLGLIIAR